MRILTAIWNAGLDPDTADPLDLRRRRTVVGIAGLLIPVAIPLMTLNTIVAGGSDVPGILVGLVVSLCVVGLQTIFGWARLAAHGITASLYFAIVMALRDTGLSDSGWAWLVGVPVIASMTMGRNGAIGWGLVSLGTLWMACLPGIVGLDPMRSAGQATTFAIETNLFMLCVTIPMIAGAELWTRTQRSLIHSEAEARAAARRAEEASAAKATFLATMSHELRTPMNGVLGATQLLRHTRLDPGQDRLVSTIEGSGEVLLDVINDILDVSRIESGRLKTEHIPVGLASVLEQVAAPLRTRAAERGVDVVVDVDPSLPEQVMGDPTRLRQILFNLGGNAVKFTESGRVEIRARNHFEWLVIEVEDSGIGIPPERLDDLFEPFIQAESSTTRRYGGSGLGLTIVQGLAQALGGDVRVRSRVGEGSCFTVRLPLEEAAPVRTPTPRAMPSSSASLRVLLADDIAVNRMVARGMLERLGHQVDEVVDGREAIEAATHGHYDVILLDVHMPEVDGLEAARAIRRLPFPVGRVPLVALTADALPQHRQAALEAGMNEHLPKPVRLDDLRRILDTVAGDVRDCGR